MGRHSAATDDESDDHSAVAVIDQDHADRPSGRHAAPPRPPSPAPAKSNLPATAKSDLPATAKADTAQIPLITDPIIDQPIPESETVRIPVITAPLLDAPPPSADQRIPSPDELANAAGEPAPSPSMARKRGAHATSADISLLRAHGDVRARAIAAVLVPFVVYVIYWLVVGHATTRSWLIWIWIPVIAAGVLFGLTLDLGHKRYGASSGQSADDAG